MKREPGIKENSINHPWKRPDKPTRKLSISISKKSSTHWCLTKWKRIQKMKWNTEDCGLFPFKRIRYKTIWSVYLLNEMGMENLTAESDIKKKFKQASLKQYRTATIELSLSQYLRSRAGKLPADVEWSECRKWNNRDCALFSFKGTVLQSVLCSSLLSALFSYMNLSLPVLLPNLQVSPAINSNCFQEVA